MTVSELRKAKTETLRCVGGPFDGQDATTDLYCLTLVRSSIGEMASAHEPMGASVSIVRSTYTRRQMSDGTAHWQFGTSTPLYLDSA